MKTKHKHRRSSSTQIRPEKENISNEYKEQVQEASSNLLQLPLVSVQIMQCLERCDSKIENKLTIIEDINIREQERKPKGLKEIEQDLKNWDEFEGNFLNLRIQKNSKRACLRDKKDKLTGRRHLIFMNEVENKNIQQSCNSFLPPEKKKCLNNR